MMNFEYPEDREFFANLLADGDVEKLEAEFSDYFDFDHPAIKREAYNKIRKRVLTDLIQKYGAVCQLQLHPDCNVAEGLQVDHIIPLSSNELNKQLRHMERTGSEKVVRQSFGSNHPRNLTLACKRCNAWKKHKFYLPRNFAQLSYSEYLDQRHF